MLELQAVTLAEMSCETRRDDTLSKLIEHIQDGKWSRDEKLKLLKQLRMNYLFMKELFSEEIELLFLRHCKRKFLSSRMRRTRELSKLNSFSGHDSFGLEWTAQQRQ